MLKSVLAAVLVVSAVGAVAACGSDAPPSSAVEIADGEARALLESTPWLDKAPEAPDDSFSAYIFQRVEGAFVTGNQYRGSYDVFRYLLGTGANATRLEFTFLADLKTAKSKFKIERVSNGPFDLRLTLKNAPRGPKVYFGFDAQHEHTLPTELQRAVDHLATHAR